jgi:hypothetical protein
MAQVRSLISSPAVMRVQVIAPPHLGDTAIAALRHRGLDARRADAPGDDLIAWAVDDIPNPRTAVELAATCRRAAEAGRPVCLYAPPLHGTGRVALERAAALAYVRAHGAAVAHDIDAWLEAVVALCRFGMPRGSRTAVIAPPGSWLEAQALCLVAEAEAAGARAPSLGAKSKDATDVVLYDPTLGAAPTHLPGMHVPVVARAELAGDDAALYGARAALGAIDVLGRAAERIAIGLGAADPKDVATLELDRERLKRQLDRIWSWRRIGDHETKVLLAAYGVPITRQLVATTPSAAVKAARKLAGSGSGYAVELKPFDNDLPTEAKGCPVERDVTSDAMVRRAFANVLSAAGRSPTRANSGAVIVRERPPLGRDIVVELVEVAALGWTVVVDVPGAPHVAAAPAPLRVIDAQMLAGAVVASRVGDPDPDRNELANLLRRASHLVVDHTDRIARLELSRVIVGGRGSRSLVVDCWAELK